MGLLDKLFVQEEEKPKKNEKGDDRSIVEVQKDEAIYDEKAEKVNISENAAGDILRNALASLEGKEPTVYTLRELISALPTGAQKDAILGVLAVTKVSVEVIKQDGQERISILNSVEKRLQEKISADVLQFEAAIKEAENQIEENRKRKADAEELLRNFQLLKSEKLDEIKNILATIE